MADIFDILPQLKETRGKSRQPEEAGVYVRMQGEFASNHLGYYCFTFIDLIRQDAVTRNPSMEVYSLDKILRELTKKYMLNDLELVHLSFISNLLQWQIHSSFITTNCQAVGYHCQQLHKNCQNLIFFLSLIACFVKRYIGDIQECRAIEVLLRKETEGAWEGLYEEWLGSCPQGMFRLSPRQVNQLYSRYTRNCQRVASNKNYNKMVDQIMELSTTYAMIPGEAKEGRKRKITREGEGGSHQLSNNQPPYLFGRKIIKVDELPHNNHSNYANLPNISNISNLPNGSKLLDLNQPQSSLQSNSFLDASCKPRKPIKLGLKGTQPKVNRHVTDMLKDKNNSSDLSMSKKYLPQSMIGIVDQNPNFFDSKMFSSGEDIIPYTRRSNSNIFKSKLFE